MPVLPSRYAWRTEFVQASVSASFRSLSVSSDSGRTRAIAVSASRTSVMYSALAGMVRRTDRSSATIERLIPPPSTRLTCAIDLAGVSGAFGEVESRVPPLVAADVGDIHGLSGRKLLGDDADDVLSGRDRPPGERDDYVAAAPELVAEDRLLLRRRAQAGRRAGRAVADVRDDGATLDAVAEALCDRRDQILRFDPDVCVRNPAGGDQLLHRAPRRVDRHRKADALRVPGVAADLRVDPDHASACVEERAARVPVVDGRVGLDRVHEAVARGQRGDRALRRRHDAHAERVRVPERASDRGNRLADLDAGGDAERNRAQPMGARIHLQQPDVVVNIPADDLGRPVVAILEW